MTDHPPRPFDADAAIRHLGEGLIACSLRREEWTHEAHLAATCWLVRERPDIVPERDLPDIIRRFNESVGGVNDETQGYHETITQVYILGVRMHVAECPQAMPLMACVNALLIGERGARDWPLRFYSRALLFSTEARRRYVAPDLAELPDLSVSRL